MPKLINWDLMKQPYNWAMVFIMCAFALIFLATIFPQDGDADLS